MKLFFLSLLALPILALAQDAELPKIDVTDSAALLANEGNEAIVTGKVTSTGSSASGINFLNFDGSDFVCVTFARNLGAFTEGSPVELYDGELIEVTGRIEMYRGSPQIKLESPDQVKILKSETPEPEPVPEAPEMVETEEPAAKPEAPAPTPEDDKSAALQPPTATDPDVELVDGQPPVDWRKYFPN